MFVGLRPGNRKKLKAESPRGPSAGPGYEPGLAASCAEGISKLEPPQWPKLSYEPDIDEDLSENLLGGVVPPQSPEWRRRSCRL